MATDISIKGIFHPHLSPQLYRRPMEKSSDITKNERVLLPPTHFLIEFFKGEVEEAEQRKWLKEHFIKFETA